MKQTPIKIYIKEKIIILCIIKLSLWSKCIKNLILSKPTTHKKNELYKKLFKIINLTKKNQLYNTLLGNQNSRNNSKTLN